MDLTWFNLEKHVEESFRTAWALAEGQPINARHALLAVLTVSGTTTSRAFSKLASLLPLTGLGKPQAEQTTVYVGPTTGQNGLTREISLG